MGETTKFTGKGGDCRGLKRANFGPVLPSSSTMDLIRWQDSLAKPPGGGHDAHPKPATRP